MSAPPIPARIDSYRIRRQLGAGGMGLVFEAVHEILGTPAAIKLAAAHVRAEPALRARFLNEAKALASIDHPGVVRILGCGQLEIPNEEPVPYIIMELLRGRSLQERLSSGPLPLDEARRIGLQVADVLRYVHRHRLVHRDLKPGNIMLLDEDSAQTPARVKLIDFGIAKVPPSSPTDGSSAPGTQLETGDDASLGTPGYMSPEQCKDARAATAPSDAYSLGVVLYEMFAGRPPFVATTRVELFTQHIRDAPPPLRRHQEAIPPAIGKLVMALLSKSPSGRPDLDAVCKILAASTPLPLRPRRRVLTVGGFLTALVCGMYLGREPLADWLVERELHRVRLEAGTVADAKRAIEKAHRWLSWFSGGHRVALPLSQGRVAHKEADVAQQEGRIDVARLGYVQALTFYQEDRQTRTRDEAQLRDRIAASSNELAQVLRHFGDDARAIEYFSQGIAEHNVLVGLPDNPERRQYLRTLVLYRRAELAADAGDPLAATFFAELHDNLESLLRSNPANANVCWHLSRVLAAEGALWARSGRGASARAQAERALQLVQEARRLAPMWRRPKIAEVEEARSDIYATLGDVEAAKAAIHAAYSRWQETVAEEPRGAYRHAWLLVCLKGARLQQGSMRDGYIQTATQIISDFEREGLYQGDVHVSQARTWLASLSEHASPPAHELPGVPVPTR